MPRFLLLLFPLLLSLPGKAIFVRPDYQYPVIGLYQGSCTGIQLGFYRNYEKYKIVYDDFHKPSSRHAYSMTRGTFIEIDPLLLHVSGQGGIYTAFTFYPKQRRLLGNIHLGLSSLLNTDFRNLQFCFRPELAMLLDRSLFGALLSQKARNPFCAKISLRYMFPVNNREFLQVTHGISGGFCWYF